jgi:hypothetical protein
MFSEAASGSSSPSRCETLKVLNTVHSIAQSILEHDYRTD